MKVRWHKISEVPPPENEMVMTKIDDEKGARNQQVLIRRGKMWFTGGANEMYVYYTPTHWMAI